MLIMRSDLGLLRRIFTVALRVTLLQHRVASRRFDAGVVDLVLTDIPDVVGVRVGLPVGTSDHTAYFMDVVLKQRIPHLVCTRSISRSLRTERRDGSQLE